MNHDAAFLASIIESPDEDAPRLIYADWLEEHGQGERADFIRVQCELARMSEDDPRRGDLMARERASREGREKEWVGPLGGLMEKCEFRRGFVEGITLAGEDFLTHAEAIFAAAPVRDAEFGRKWDDSKGTLSRLAASSSLARLETVGLGFSNFCLDDTSLQALASLPPLLQRLDRLSVILCPITEAGVFSLVMSPHLQRLGSLNLSYCMIRGERGAGRWPNLRSWAASPRSGSWTPPWGTRPCGCWPTPRIADGWDTSPWRVATWATQGPRPSADPRTWHG
jgi:uncharacterized protein (TIGR02996 family)